MWVKPPSLKQNRGVAMECVALWPFPEGRLRLDGAQRLEPFLLVPESFWSSQEDLWWFL